MITMRYLTLAGDSELTLDAFTVQESVDLDYPVGAIYMTTDVTKRPSSIYGGVWQQIKDKFLLASSSSYALGGTGGESSHTLTKNELPSHSHPIYNVYSVLTSRNCYSSGEYGALYTTTSTGTTQATGGGGSHNNMPPYEVVEIWKRTS